MQITVVLAVAAAGGLGAVCRYACAQWFESIVPHPSIATAIVNVAGCFGFGVCFGLGSGRWTPLVSAAVLAGFFGAFTTFSSFASDGHSLLAARRYGAFAANAIVQNALGLLALWAGLGLTGRLR